MMEIGIILIIPHTQLTQTVGTRFPHVGLFGRDKVLAVVVMIDGLGNVFRTPRSKECSRDALDLR